MERIDTDGINDVHNTNLKHIYNNRIILAITIFLIVILSFWSILCFSDKFKVVSVLRDEVMIGDDVVVMEPTQKDPINVSLEEINSLNIIINDADCLNEFINSVCQELETDGVKFTYTKDSENIDVDGAVIITLDQLYMAGPGTAVLAPFKNGHEGNSDALALAAQRAFYEKGFLMSGIACGKTGFRENEDGSISERIPTPTEEAVGDYTDASFVTISFGTSNTPPRLVASAIEATLTRYYSYVNDNYMIPDLIYCVEDGQSYEEIASILGSTVEVVDKYNKTIDESMLLVGEAIINPVVGEIREFNQSVPTNLYVDKTPWSK